MYNDLIKIANSVFGEQFVSSLAEEVANLKRDFNGRFNLVNGSSFEDKGDFYELTLEVAEDATAKNVTVDLEDGVVTVSYEYKANGVYATSKVVETLPEDADEDTLEASVEDGVVSITVDKVEELEVEDEPEDTRTIKINRK